VGDSRLYRLTPAGQLLRETDDHSVVEEEVRAGRMTAEQAANHPSKNVISRALGAENSVEVDMKVIEVDEGTEFLLCTDGITRHIPDREIRQLLLTHDDLAAVCAELKQRCFERGAEDNLTAILVCVGTPISAQQRSNDLDRTIQPEIAPAHAGLESDGPQTPLEQTMLGTHLSPEAFVPPSRKAFPGNAPPKLDDTLETEPVQGKLDIAKPAPQKSGVERTMTRFFLFVIVLAAVAGAFYAGRKYKGIIPYLDRSEPSITVASPTPAPVVVSITPGEEALLKFEKARREVDNDPNAWLATQSKSELTRQGIQNPLDSTDGYFLYLYGRASLLASNSPEAARAFEAAITKANLGSPQETETIKKEATIGLAAAALKSEAARAAALKHFEEATRPPQPPPSGSPSVSPLSSP
jgi:protein phosphatase